MNILRAYFTTLLAAIFCVLPAPQVKAARSFTAASSQYLELTSAVVTSTPLTMACWAKPADTSAARNLMSIGVSGGTARWQLVYNNGGAAVCTAIDSGGSGSNAVAGTAASGSWNHYCGVWSSDSVRTAYYNGTAGTPTAVSSVVSGVNRTIIGARINAGSYGLYFNGDMAECAIWNVALSANEIASLAAGFSPRLIRPSALVFYAPLINSLQELRGGTNLTNVNSTTAADHPRVYQ